MSHISWVLTSNKVENVSEPVRTRCQVIEIPDVTTEQLQEFAVKKGADCGLSEAAVEAVLMAVDQAPVVTGRAASFAVTEQRLRNSVCCSLSTSVVGSERPIAVIHCFDRSFRIAVIRARRSISRA